MEIMTAEQAREAARGLTFEDVWAALMESKQRMEESKLEAEKRMEESRKNMDETFARMDKRNAEFEAKLNKSLGGFGNSLGRLTEAMFTAKLCEKFDELGFTFDTQANNKKFHKNKRVLAEVDSVLENGEYVMLVEIKAELVKYDVDGHLKRMGIIREYMDRKSDKRKLVGAVAGGVIAESILGYALENGLFVLVQSGESVAVADMPESFKARQW